MTCDDHPGFSCAMPHPVSPSAFRTCCGLASSDFSTPACHPNTSWPTPPPLITFINVPLWGFQCPSASELCILRWSKCIILAMPKNTDSFFVIVLFSTKPFSVMVGAIYLITHIVWFSELIYSIHWWILLAMEFLKKQFQKANMALTYPYSRPSTYCNLGHQGPNGLFNQYLYTRSFVFNMC